jgi:hypothetical protein
MIRAPGMTDSGLQSSSLAEAMQVLDWFLTSAQWHTLLRM